MFFPIVEVISYSKRARMQEAVLESPLYHTAVKSLEVLLPNLCDDVSELGYVEE